MNKKKKQSDPPITIRDKRVKYQDGYNDEFYFEYQRSYNNHKGQVHPSRPSKLPKDLKIEYLDQYENENPKTEIPHIDRDLERIWEEGIGVWSRGGYSSEGNPIVPSPSTFSAREVAQRKFDLKRRLLVGEENTVSVEIDGRLPNLVRVLQSSIKARYRNSQIQYTDFFSNIIIHTKAIIELGFLHKPVFHEIGVWVPGGIISWHDFNLHLLLSSSTNLYEWKFISAIWELMDSMTIRQKAMYDLLNQGLSYREIGKLCQISHQSVSDHLEAIKKKAKKTSILLNENVDTKYNWLISHLHIGILIDDLLEIGPFK